MDFDSLTRRDLQFFCKRNKIPANMTNIAMADALKSLELVEGIDEFMNQSESIGDLSSASVAKNLPSAARTAVRRTRGKTAKDESSDLVTRSCYVTRKSVAEEMDQENRNDANRIQDPSVVNQSRGRRAAASSVKAQEAASSIQRVYSTRRTVKLLEESMGGLSLKTEESLAKKKEDSPTGSESQVVSDGKSEETEEAEVVLVRDLNDSLEKEWDGVKNDPDLDILYGDLGDISFSDETTMNESNIAPASDSFVVDQAASTVTNKEEAVESKETESDEDTKEREAGEDEWSDFDIDDVVVEYEELIVSKTEEAHVSDHKENVVEDKPALQIVFAADKENVVEDKPALKIVFAADNDHKNKEDVVEMVLNSNEEGKSEATDSKKEKKKTKMIDEESFKDISMRQLTKMVKELAIKNKQQHKSLE